MGFFSNLFKKKTKQTTQTVTTQSHKPLTDNKKPTILVSDGGLLPSAEIIANIYPAYYKKLFVILDNGHGENTAGKRSPDGRLREYKYCREIVAVLEQELRKLGMGVYVLVPETTDISLSERVKRANKIHTEQHKLGNLVVLISVHCNAAGNGEWKNARGWSGWTSVGQTAGDALATCLYDAAHEILDPKDIKIRSDKSDGDEDWEANFTIIYKSSMPAVLTENFFQDNKEDVDYLLSDEGRADVVKIHVEGLKKYAERNLA